MSLLNKIKTAVEIFKEDGINGIAAILIHEYRWPLPQTAKITWKAGIRSQRQFWDNYFATRGLHWKDQYDLRFDPNLPLQPRPAALLPRDGATINILDVGAGPITYLGKVHDGKKVTITATDALADEFDKILKKHDIDPPVHTQLVSAEELTQKFAPNTFDLVFARNCIDHTYDPEQSVLQMITVVKPGQYVLMEHVPNEAIHQDYDGVHQWNFSQSSLGEFLISSKTNTINMTKKYEHLCLISCEIISEDEHPEWLVTRIQKK